MTKKALYNPLSIPFVTRFDVNGDMHPQEFTINPKEIGYFEEPVYSHMKKHLARAYARVMHTKINWEEDVKRAERVITDIVV